MTEQFQCLSLEDIPRSTSYLDELDCLAMGSDLVFMQLLNYFALIWILFPWYYNSGWQFEHICTLYSAEYQNLSHLELSFPPLRLKDYTE